MEIENIIEAVQAGRVIPSRHRLREAAADDLLLGEVYESVMNGEILESDTGSCSKSTRSSSTSKTGLPCQRSHTHFTCCGTVFTQDLY